jgi:hypothetical protein
MTLTLGFGLGAAVTGALAQWGPAPGQTPYLLHLALCLLAAAVLWTAPETVGAATAAPRPWWSDLRVPSAGSAAFRRLILPAAPWVFGAAGVAYAVMPAVVEPRLGPWGTVYASILTLLALGVGAAVQGLVPRLNRLTRGRGLVVGLTGTTAGMALSAVAALTRSPLLALVVALVLGASYGVCMMAGLLIVQGIATPDDLAGLTGRYYSLTYIGFLLPAVLAAIAPVVPYPLALAAVAALCAGSLTAVAVRHSRSTSLGPAAPATGVLSRA